MAQASQDKFHAFQRLSPTPAPLDRFCVTSGPSASPAMKTWGHRKSVFLGRGWPSPCPFFRAHTLTEGAVWEAAGELEVAGNGEDVKEVKEDVHGHDAHHAEARLRPDVPQLTLSPHRLHLAHLVGTTCLRVRQALPEGLYLNGDSPTAWGSEGEGRLVACGSPA